MTVVQYRPGQLDGATASLRGLLGNLRGHVEDRVSSGTTYVQAGSGQFSDRFNEVNTQYRTTMEEATKTIEQMISAVEEAKTNNGARDARSAASI
ncbi:hypothetical protein [Mycobacteroides abscessus]|uniref:hypothetical protein n=1 Tax=Mycobacteroides abscessus TaxID=36809 RepID=UPI0018965A74